MEESLKIRKQVQEDAKVEKRRQQVEAAAKAAEVAREAMKALEKHKVASSRHVSHLPVTKELRFPIPWLFHLQEPTVLSS